MKNNSHPSGAAAAYHSSNLVGRSAASSSSRSPSTTSTASSSRSSRRTYPRSRVDRCGLRLDHRRVLLRLRLRLSHGGRQMDRWGVKRGLPIFVLLWSCAATAHGLCSFSPPMRFSRSTTRGFRGPKKASCGSRSQSNGAAGFMLARIALGLAEGGDPGAIKAVAEWYPRKNAPSPPGLFNAGTNVGAIVCPIVVPWLYAHLGWQWTFALHRRDRLCVGRPLVVCLRSARKTPAPVSLRTCLHQAGPARRGGETRQDAVAPSLPLPRRLGLRDRQHSRRPGLGVLSILRPGFSGKRSASRPRRSAGGPVPSSRSPPSAVSPAAGSQVDLIAAAGASTPPAKSRSSSARSRSCPCSSPPSRPPSGLPCSSSVSPAPRTKAGPPTSSASSPIRCPKKP